MAWVKYILITVLLMPPAFLLIVISHTGKYCDKWFDGLVNFKGRIAPKPAPPKEEAGHYHHESRSITQCMADDDGACYGVGCPQLRDGEPTSTGRHCPLDKPL